MFWLALWLYTVYTRDICHNERETMKMFAIAQDVNVVDSFTNQTEHSLEGTSLQTTENKVTVMGWDLQADLTSASRKAGFAGTVTSTLRQQKSSKDCNQIAPASAGVFFCPIT